MKQLGYAVLVASTVLSVSGCLTPSKDPADLRKIHLYKVGLSIKTAKEKHMVFVVDGKVADAKAVAALDSTKIEKATTFSGDEEAVNLYGPDAKNGVIVITDYAASDTVAKGDPPRTADSGGHKSKP